MVTLYFGIKLLLFPRISASHLIQYPEIITQSDTQKIWEVLPSVQKEFCKKVT